LSQPVLIVGSAGQDGSLLRESARQRGDSVVGITRDRVDLDGQQRPFDIRNPGEVRDLVARLQPREIYYLAARHQSSEDVAPQDGALFDESLQVNVSGLITFLDAVRTVSASSRLFYASSSHVFGGAGPPLRDESTPLNPDSIYGISKSAGQLACRHYRKTHNVFAAVGIMFTHESPRRRNGFVSRKIVHGAVSIKRGRASKVVLGDLEASVDWGYAPDFVAAMLKIMALEAADEFIVATGECHTVGEFAQHAFSALELDYREHIEVAPGMLKRRTAAFAGNPAKLARAAGWRPSLAFKDMVRILVDAEMKEHPA
jgi:GDPmannose 4,6-dehydratase